MGGRAANVTRDAITKVLQAHFKPEFLNRIDEIIIFHSLSREDLVHVVEIQLRHVSALLAERGYRLDISPEARAYLAEVGYDADYGARPLKRAIQRELQDPLAVKILSGEFHEGETIHVERGKEKLEFTVLKSEHIAVS
jgi:ATP-dependent Clp protease ATP-binding subunit ClpB